MQKEHLQRYLSVKKFFIQSQTMTLALALKHAPAQPGVQTLFRVLQPLALKILIFNKSSTRALISDAEVRLPSSAVAACT